MLCSCYLAVSLPQALRKKYIKENPHSFSGFWFFIFAILFETTFGCLFSVLMVPYYFRSEMQIGYLLVVCVSFTASGMSWLSLRCSAIDWDFSDSVPRNHVVIGLGGQGMGKVEKFSDLVHS